MYFIVFQVKNCVRVLSKSVAAALSYTSKFRKFHNFVVFFCHIHNWQFARDCNFILISTILTKLSINVKEDQNIHYARYKSHLQSYLIS